MKVPAALAEIAPGNVIWAAINRGNRVTAPVACKLADALGDATGVPIALIDYANADAILAAEKDAWDIAFLAIDSALTDTLYFTESFLSAEATYAVRADSPIFTVQDLDREGVRIAASRDAAYTRELQHTLRRATVAPFRKPAAAFEACVSLGLEAVAATRAELETFFAGRADYRVLPDAFFTVQQAIATHADRPLAGALLDRFLAQSRVNGVLAKALGEK